MDVEAAAALFLAALTGILLMVELYGGNRVEPLMRIVWRVKCRTFCYMGSRYNAHRSSGV